VLGLPKSLRRRWVAQTVRISDELMSVKVAVDRWKMHGVMVMFPPPAIALIEAM